MYVTGSLLINSQSADSMVNICLSAHNNYQKIIIMIYLSFVWIAYFFSTLYYHQSKNSSLRFNDHWP